VTPKKAGIPHFIIPDGQAYQIAEFILESYTWMVVQQEGDEFFLLKGRALVDLDHDLMVFAHPYRQAQVTAAVRDEVARRRDPLPRWTRTRWLAMEYIKGALDGTGIALTLQCYDYRANKPVSATCRGIKKIDRLMASGNYSLITGRSEDEPQ
jgi:hypothetical protein